MSIASLDLRPTPDISVPIPEETPSIDGVPMKLQNRIRFDCYLMVGHAGVLLDFHCHAQAPFELERDGPRTTEVFADRVDECLQEARMEEELGEPVPQEIRDAVRAYIFSLDDGESRDINFRAGPVSLCGQTFCVPSWRPSA